MGKNNQKTESLITLRNAIVEAINNGVKDLGLIDGEEYQHVYFIRCVNECWYVYGKACNIDRRRTLCNIYADYCTRSCYPFIEDEKERNEKFLNAIKNHFYDLEQ